MLFRDLSKDAKCMYHVVARCRNRKTNQFFHKINTLADYAGLNHYSAVYAIRELIDKGIISRETRPGHSSIYTFLTELDLFEPVEMLPPTSSDTLPLGSSPVLPHNNKIEQKQLTTTQWLSDKLLENLSKQYGPDEVEKRVVVISKMNGNVKNKAGLLVASLKGNYIPDSKELRAKEEAERIKIATELRRKEMLEAHEKMIREREESSGKIDFVSDFEKLIADRAKEN